MAKAKNNMEKEKKFVWGQYFTKKQIVDKLIELLLEYKPYSKKTKVLEPSSGTGNFVIGLKEKGFNNISECEIDPLLTENPCDFFLFPIEKKFDLIIGNPPFTKYNLKNSYYYPKDYESSRLKSSNYLTSLLEKKSKTQIENAFILKSMKHLNRNGSIAFVLPISFFIAKKNKEVKRKIIDNFSTIIIYQNDKTWFDEPIPCCFAILKGYGQNIPALQDNYKDKVILLYEDGGKVEEILDKKQLLTDELIPKSFLYKKNNHKEGKPLSEFLSDNKAKHQRDYTKNNVSGANILQKTKIPRDKNVEEYLLGVTRVGNASVGKTGLINIKEDVLNDMFFVFAFKNEYNKNKELKEKICSLINQNQEHIKNLTIRVGSKSIKKRDILDLKIKV